MRRALILGLAGAGIAFGVAMAQPGQSTRPPAVQWSGPDSAIEELRWERVRSPEAWRNLWAAHRGERASLAAQGWVLAPEIDFERYEVVAYFRGQSANNNGERASAVFVREGVNVLRFDSASFQTASFDGEDKGVAGRAFGIWVIERSDRAIVVEENVQGLIGGEPVWREVMRFEPPA